MSIYVRFTCHWYGLMGWQPVMGATRMGWVH